MTRCLINNPADPSLGRHCEDRAFYLPSLALKQQKGLVVQPPSGSGLCWVDRDFTAHPHVTHFSDQRTGGSEPDDFLEITDQRRQRLTWTPKSFLLFVPPHCPQDAERWRSDAAGRTPGRATRGRTQTGGGLDERGRERPRSADSLELSQEVSAFSVSPFLRGRGGDRQPSRAYVIASKLT